MRIIHICQRDDPDTGGSLRVAEALVKEQRRVGIDAWILFLYGSPAQIAEEFSHGVACLGIESSKEAFKGVVKLRKAIWRIKPDVIHFHDGIIWPRLAILFCHTPTVMHTHLPVAMDSGWLSRNLVRRSTRLFLGISLHTIDSWVDSDVRPSRIQYTPNGVDFDRFYIPSDQEKTELRESLGLPKEKHMLLWVGRLHQAMKGSDRVEHVARTLSPDYVLVVVGNGPEYEGMQVRCRNEIDEGKLLMIGSDGRPELYYRAADEFLFTSYHEPFGLVILEAVASGLPILSFPLRQGGGATKLLADFNAVELPDHVDAAVLDKALSHGAITSEEKQSRRATAMKTYSWSMLNKRIVDAYSLVLNKRGCRL